MDDRERLASKRVEQQRSLLERAPSDYDMLSIMRVMCEEMRHGWQMAFLLVAHFGDEGKREAPKLLEKGYWDRDGSGIPSSPSGGLLGVGNPIAAAGVMKAAEIYYQLAGKAGPRQVKRNLKRGLAQAWGGLMQVGTVIIMGV